MKAARMLLFLFVLGLGLFLRVPTVEASRLRGASVTIGTSAPSTSTTHAYGFSITTAGNFRRATFTYCTAASGACTTPTGLGFSSALTNQSGVSGWTLASATSGVVTIEDPSAAENMAADAYVTFTINGVTNPGPVAGTGCPASSNNSSSTCFVRFQTYSDLGTTTVDDTTATITVVSSVSVTATVDPTFTFLIQAVGSGTVNNGITTSVSSTFSTLPFGNLTASTPKYAAHQLNVTTNTQSGYTVTAILSTQMTGVYTSNNIDEYAGGTWSAPTPWTEPTGTTANTNTGWLGANTTDGDVSSGAFTWTVFGPVQTSTANNVMRSTTSDNGGTAVYVSYVVEANVYQPADTYTGTLVYNALPTY